MTYIDSYSYWDGKSARSYDLWEDDDNTEYRVFWSNRGGYVAMCSFPGTCASSWLKYEDIPHSLREISMYSDLWHRKKESDSNI